MYRKVLQIMHRRANRRLRGGLLLPLRGGEHPGLRIPESAVDGREENLETREA